MGIMSKRARCSDCRCRANTEEWRSRLRQFQALGAHLRTKLRVVQRLSRLLQFRLSPVSQGAKLLGAVALAVVLSGCSFFGLLDVDDVIAQTSGLSYPIVDTGQVEFYGNTSQISEPAEGQAFYGQDAQIDGNQMDYVDTGDGTVTDLVTGLMWTQGYYGKMTYSEALSYAGSFTLAGYSDWRLPTVKELYSLIDFSGEDVNPQASSANNPFIDDSVFDFAYGDTSAGERIIDSQWTTTTLYTGDSGFGGGDLMFGVNFADGRIKGYPVNSTMGPGGQEKTYYVRLVRGNTAYGQNDFLSNGDGTITDLATGLMWSQVDSGVGLNWEEALAYVQDLNDQNYLGYSDWTLPNAKELQSIVDYDRSPDATSSAAIAPIFNATSITNEDGERDWGHYWSGTTHVTAMGGQSAVYIAFGRGLGYMNGQFIDVHGAGCQRSDPKTGSASYGNGPQGDVRRVDNFVRVVRDVSGTVSAASSPDASSGSSDSPNSHLAADSSDTGEAGGKDQQYVLFAPLGGEEAYLIDRQGDLVKTWTLAGRPGNSVYLLEGGDLLATYTIQGKFQQGGVGGGVELLTWDGNQVWSFELANESAHLHHDIEMLPNGNVLMISWEAFSRSEAIAAGLSANQLPDSGEVWAEMILEYDPDLDQVVWEWHLWDHVLPEGWEAEDHPEKVDLDYFANARSEDWWHFNAVAYSAEHDQIILSSRAASEFWIIDHDLTTAEAAGDAGDLLYRWGNPAAYGGSGSQVLVDQHDSEFVDEDTILVFDNGNPRSRPYSRVVEIDLPEYENGLFEDADIVWEYGAASGDEHFFSDHISGSQRLSSGNTLICSGVEGRFFEVTEDGEVVWEYTNPFTATTPDGRTAIEVFRCEAYSADFIGDVLAYADLSDAQVGASSEPPEASPNFAVGNQAASGPGTGQTPAGGPPGIASVSPTTLTSGAYSQALTITLNTQFAPPAQVQFTRVAIDDVTATTWTRSGNTVQAWFDIPSQLPAGEYALTITFPGRNQEAITFRFPIDVR